MKHIGAIVTQGSTTLQESVVNALDRWSFCILILYSSDTLYEKRLSNYIKKNYGSLDLMSGSKTAVYSWEHWNSDSLSVDAPDESRPAMEWMTTFESEKTRPFNKSEAYRIARELGTSLDQVPCLLVATRLKSKERLKAYHLPTYLNPLNQETFTAFFKKLFSVIDKCDPGDQTRMEKLLEKKVFPKRKAKRSVRVGTPGLLESVISATTKGIVDSLTHPSPG